MDAYATAFSDTLDPEVASRSLARALEAQLGEPVAGALLLATAAGADAGRSVGAALAARWPGALLAGTSFEGVLAEGRVVRDRPAVVAIGWGGVEAEPVPFLLESEVFGKPAAVDLDEVVHVLEDARDGPLDADDLVLLFPDALKGVAVERQLSALAPRVRGAVFAGAAAAGPGTLPACAWVGEVAEKGGTLGVILPGGAAGGHRLGSAGSTRFASPWLRVDQCRSRWVDELDGEPALDWVRRQLGLEPADPVEPHLDRLRVRLREEPSGRPRDALPDESDLAYLERYVVGLDRDRGAIAVPAEVARGAELAFALPDPDHARATLRAAAEGLAPSPVVLQFACRARDEMLHGDPDLEGAWLQHAVGDRVAVGTLAPFQIGPAPGGRACQLLHATLLAAIGGR